MKLLTRLKNIWRLGGIDFYPNGMYEKREPTEIDKEFTIKPRAPQAQIIKRVIVDPLEEVLKE
jgi:hypothetical protein